MTSGHNSGSHEPNDNAVASRITSGEKKKKDTVTTRFWNLGLRTYELLENQLSLFRITKKRKKALN